ncbi:YceI family protein [Tellurirhabdus bombi]|uniref:YceI family protein n=1 Tax=Tellurirhabdus bombi TaxID=2907205 RepID=UPI001F21A199|nr:YceI family protein [Tellurirhabdus bombi]
MKATQLFAGLLAVTLLASTPVLAANSDKNPKKAVAKASTYTIDANESTVNWNGKKVTGEHFGTIKISKGSLLVDGSKLTGGTVDIDLRTMTSTDLKDNKEYHDKLINHLKSDDFFGVDKYPTATFKITKVTPKSGNQYDVTGDLSIKGKTNPVTFPVTVNVKGNTLEAAGKATVDRSKYDIRYGSKSFFDNLGDKAINDEFTLDLKVVAKK